MDRTVLGTTMEVEAHMRFVLALLIALTLTIGWQSTVLATGSASSAQTDTASDADRDTKKKTDNGAADDEPDCE
jgi:hypothetical protein